MLHIAIFLCMEDLILIRNVQSVEIKYFYCSVHDCFAYLLILAFNMQDVLGTAKRHNRAALKIHIFRILRFSDL